MSQKEEKRDNEMKVNCPQEGNVKVSTKELVIDVHLRHQRQHWKRKGHCQLKIRGRKKKEEEKLLNYHFNLIHCGAVITKRENNDDFPTSASWFLWSSLEYMQMMMSN